MKEGLSLPRAAFEFARWTVFFQLRNVTANRAPAFDLALVVNGTTAHVITAVPLKPAAWILVIDPTLLAPHRERHRSVHRKIVELRIVTVRRELRLPKPRRRKLVAAVSHVLAAKHAQLEHLLRGQLRLEIRSEVLAGRFRAEVHVPGLHSIVNFNATLLHCFCLRVAGQLTTTTIGAGLFASAGVSIKKRDPSAVTANE